MTQRSLSKRIALVSGASRGIGRAIALKLAHAGAKVAVLGRDRDKLSRVQEEITAMGGEAHALVCDLANERAVTESLAGLLAKWGEPEILMNNAGFGGPFHRADEVPLSEWRTIFGANIDGPYFLTRAVLPAMKARGWGRIINISSVQGLTGGALSSTYAATKHALIGYTRSIAAEWGRYGITCNAVCPGYIETEMLAAASVEAKEGILRRVPAQRFGTPEEVADLVEYLSSPLAAYVNGSTLVIDGGLSSHLASELPSF